MSNLELEAPAHSLVDCLLAAIFDAAPFARSVSLGIIDSQPRDAGAEALRYSLTNSVSLLPHIGHARLPDRPLTDWSSFLAPLKAGKPKLVRVNEVSAAPLRTYFRATGASGFLACPVIGPRADLLGAVFSTWAGLEGVFDKDRSSPGAASAALMAATIRVSGQIAALLDLCRHAARQPVPAFADGTHQCLA